jgi:hypothetical protein
MSRRLPDRGGIAIRALILAGWIGFPCWTSFSDRPGALVPAILVVAIHEARRRLGLRNLPLGAMVLAGVVLGGSLCLFTGEINWWLYVKDWVPGSRAIRAVARGLLLAMIPAALGLACFFEWVRERPRYRVAACALALFCMVEQGGSTPSYDKFTKRSDTARLAGRIDPRCQAFYYSPANPSNRINDYHLDAMWAGIETGIPTINGYPGLTPPGWLPLGEAAVNQKADLDRLGPALWRWARLHGLDAQEICWIHGRNERSFTFCRWSLVIGWTCGSDQRPCLLAWMIPAGSGFPRQRTND